ncbi:penicillin-binding protein PBP2X [Streptococcus gallolyticus subsp. gallolyticus]|uniref:penicillin-binding protein PBP2X n=1 Tax=Streptococcus gallolyticus TaxID=315405 RepID=UPI000201B496|nr:penicillin-binding protein PBP2X [Streptococcus gallolyticus]MCY7157466.1 penicillin-binding protein PBP2X [Streptococcus gallolyticus subsp. gallolyticus]BAK27335.1 penicillin-binding protein 3/cell division protein [Streptococcus gallolyticus subsp. gallolyticus ATCC 43143]CBZ47576.1 penicillin-binding protein 2X [Streptococcus gallolyticus subsp. gallolyticus ATCC BAA-2069]
MKKLMNRFLDYVVKDRRTPNKNRERVGQNLMILAVFLFFVFVINFAIIIGTDTKFGHNLSTEASEVYQQTVTVQAKRGTIYDRNGVALAEDSTTYSIYAIISTSYVSSTGEKLYVKKSQYEKVADILNEQLGIDKDEVLSQLKQDGLFQVSFGSSGSGLSYSTKSAIETAMDEAGIKGIGFTSTPGRMYPNGIFASQFLGLTQLKENKDGTSSLVGTSGLEAALDDILSGTDGKVTYQKDKNGNLLLGTETTVKQAVDGKDVYTTLSEPLQSYLESQMDIFQNEAQGTYASATVVNAKTGEILATTQRPTYNAQTLDGYSEDNLKTWNTLLYQNYYEPGSTMKVMTLASAIDDGVFNPNEVISTINGITVADTTINDWNVNEGMTSVQYLTYAQGFAWSSNVAMTSLEQKMGNDKWLTYLSRFKFGYPTRFGMLNEDSGLLPSDNEVTVAMSSFGQGIGVTQVQMLRAFTAISNGGVMLEPQFISQIYDPNTNSARVATSEVVGNPVSEDAADQTLDYMVTVGTDSQYGTLYNSTTGQPYIQVGDYSVAVKSGTAQIAASAEDGGGYLTGDNDYIYSVVAIVPSDDPEFIMYVTLQQPSEKFRAMYWQDVVNPVLERAMMIKDTLTSTAVTGTDTETEYTLKDYIGESPGDTAQELRDNLVQPVVVGSGSKIKKMSKKVGSNLSANEQILLWTGDLETVPDMYGWTKENVEKFAKWTGIKITFKGSDSGTVTKQSVESETDIDGVKKITITLGE